MDMIFVRIYGKIHLKKMFCLDILVVVKILMSLCAYCEKHN